MNNRPLRIALPKGRILKDASVLLEAVGIFLPKEMDESRKLTFKVPYKEHTIEILLSKPVDVPTYVEHGVADIGIVGSDVLLEKKPNVYELVNLELSKCYLALAQLRGRDIDVMTPKIATKYPTITREYFKRRGTGVEIIELNGSIELAPLLGLSDYIVDIVSTGSTLRENNLIEVEHVAYVSSRLIANVSSYRLRGKQIQQLAHDLSSHIEQDTKTYSN